MSCLNLTSAKSFCLIFPRGRGWESVRVPVFRDYYFIKVVASSEFLFLGVAVRGMYRTGYDFCVTFFVLKLVPRCNCSDHRSLAMLNILLCGAFILQ